MGWEIADLFGIGQLGLLLGIFMRLGSLGARIDRVERDLTTTRHTRFNNS